MLEARERAAAPERVVAPAPELSVVVPCYNERANVAPLVAALEAALAGIAWEVIFVDDFEPGRDCFGGAAPGGFGRAGAVHPADRAAGAFLSGDRGGARRRRPDTSR